MVNAFIPWIHVKRNCRNNILYIKQVKVLIFNVVNTYVVMPLMFCIYFQGHGNDVDYIQPTIVNFGENVKALQVSCGFNHTGALLEYV